jgi:Dolichyl-phosphate-mannose-protein mannosyltransferase
MLSAMRSFQVGRPQVFAGLMLLVFMAQCVWVAGSRKFSELEYQYIAAGLPKKPGMEYRVTSPLTSWLGAAPFRLARQASGANLTQSLIIPRPWLVRTPFIIFGVWLGAALWWVARRLFDDAGGYVALALYCSSPAMVMISTNIGPEIILAWSGFGLIYTAIGVAHTLLAPPRKWVPRILLLGLAVGLSLSAQLWSFPLVFLAMAFMVYLAPGRRREVFIVLSGALVIGFAVYSFFTVVTGGHWVPIQNVMQPHLTKDLLHILNFAFADGFLKPNSYLFVALFIAALTAYGSWPRARYFGNTAPLLTAFLVVLLFALVPGSYLWSATLGLSFVFLFIGGIAADLLETPAARRITAILLAGLLLRVVLGLWALGNWIKIPV